jgi:hypothetical protein
MSIPQVTTKNIEDFINFHNKELPKDPNAPVNELIIGDNEVSKTVRAHIGTLATVVGYGGYGSGKTWTCYKIFHDLKNEVFVTYVPLRYYKEQGRRLTKNSEGVDSLVATAIAEALVRPQSLRLRIPEVLTNAPDLQGISIDRKIEEVLKDYDVFLRKKGGEEKKLYHVVLLDEVDEGIESVADLVSLKDYVVTSRRIFDKHGSLRTMLVTLMAPVPSPSIGARTERGEIKPIHRLVEEAFFVPEPFKALALLNVNLNERGNLMSMLRGFVVKSLELVNKKFGLTISIKDLDDALELLARTWPSIRWCRDVLTKALAKSITRGPQSSLLDNVCESLGEALDLDPLNVDKILTEGKWSYVGYSLEGVKDFVERLLKDACAFAGPEYRGECYGERTEPGFISILCRVSKLDKRKGVISKELAFWLRLSDVANNKTIAKAKRIFGNKYVVPIVPENIRLMLLPDNTLKIIKLPSPLVYYLLASERALDAEFKGYCMNVLAEEVKKHALELGQPLKELLE